MWTRGKRRERYEAFWIHQQHSRLQGDTAVPTLPNEIIIHVRFKVLTAASMMFRVVFWSETSVDNHFTRQYIPEDNSGDHHTCLGTALVDYRLGGVVVSVLATGPKVLGFKPCRGGEFLWSIKINSTLSFRWEVKQDAPCRKILRHVKDPLRYFRYSTDKIFTPLTIPPTNCEVTQLVGLPERFGGRVKSFPKPASSSSSPWLSTYTYHRGMNNSSIGSRGSETWVSTHQNNQSINHQRRGLE
jgi:hypothetical protein